MVLHKRGKHWYGDDHADLHLEIGRYSGLAGYPAVAFADCRCECGADMFLLFLDERAGAAVRRCAKCGSEHAIADSAAYLHDANMEECECPCGNDVFQLSVAGAVYQGTQDIRWIHIGCRCVECGLIAVYGDWKCDAGPVEEVLSKA